VTKANVKEMAAVLGQTNFSFYTPGFNSIPQPATANWQKAIGGCSCWIYGSYYKSGSTGILSIYIKIKDRYNFNAGEVDIETGLPDNIFGRFSVLGWAKEFTSVGTYIYSGTIL